MNSTLDSIPELGDTILIRNLDGSLELTKYPLRLRHPYEQYNFRNWWWNYSDRDFFCEWIKVDHTNSF